MHKLKKNVKNALKQAKKLEKEPSMTTKQVVQLYKKGFEQAEKLKKLLKKSWFLKDIRPRSKAKKK